MHTPGRPVAQFFLYQVTQVMQIDDDIAYAMVPKQEQVPDDERRAANGQQGFGNRVRERTEACTEAGSQYHGSHSDAIGTEDKVIQGKPWKGNNTFVLSTDPPYLFTPSLQFRHIGSKVVTDAGQFTIPREVSLHIAEYPWNIGKELGIVLDAIDIDKAPGCLEIALNTH